MTEDRLPLAELLAKSGDGDFLRTIAESVLQIIMEAELEMARKNWTWSKSKGYRVIRSGSF